MNTGCKKCRRGVLLHWLFRILFMYFFIHLYLVTFRCNTSSESPGMMLQLDWWWLVKTGMYDSRKQGCRNRKLVAQFVTTQRIQNYRVSGLCPSSGILNTRKHNVSKTGPVSVLGWGEGTPILLGSLERANLNHWSSDSTLRKWIWIYHLKWWSY
jgi:hypothetical protein